MNIGVWLRGLGLERYTDAFEANAIDHEVLSELTEADLEKLGVLLGHRKKLLKAIADLAARAGDAPPATAAEAVLRTARATGAERRQLTVLFCDLVGSTKLSVRLDPEEMGGVIRAYQNAVAGEITRFEGHVAKYMGDGVLAYFGYPRAHEDEAERAVRAALALVDAVGALATPTGEPLVARVGIATGLVMVGELIGKDSSAEHAVVGEAPNLAARLQAIAAPGSILIAQGTRNLLGGLFEYRDLGAQRIDGFAEPVGAWQVVGLGAAESRFEALHAAGLTPLVGRDHELDLLLDRWLLAKSGEGQVVLLSGEAGIGKSRLTQALLGRLMDEPHTRLRYHCSPYHTNSALHPIIDQLERAAGFAADDTSEVKLGRLEALLEQSSERVTEVASLIASLLSIPTGDRYARLDLAPQAQKARTFEALLGQLVRLARRQPVLMVFEDAHWIDPTTSELLELVMDRLQDLPILLLITLRAEFSPPWTGHAHLTSLTLNRLGRNQSAAMVARLARGKRLPDDVVDQILQRADGVPLFIEELTKTVLESGLVEERDTGFVLNGPLPPLAIPSTLHDSLVARLDNLAPAKELAQTGAAIGREFSYGLLVAVSPLSADQLEPALDQLIKIGLLFRRGTPPDAVYVFKHALVRDVAYETLLKNRRIALHAQIHDALRHGFPHLLETEPEVLAYHATRAGDYVAAVDYWLRAGRKAASRSANAEAVSHLSNGLQWLRKLPEDETRNRIELSYLISLGPALMTTAGWDADEVDQIYSRANVLARKTNQAAALFPAAWGLWLVAHAGGAMVRASELLAELLELARVGGDDDLMLQAHHAGGSEMCSEGLFEEARRHIDAGIGLYRPERHADQALRYGGHDPCVCAHSLGALTHLMLGYPEQAERYSRGALDLAQRVEHRPSVAHADLYRAELCHLLGRPVEVEERARRVVQIAEIFGLAHYAAWGQMLIGWSRSAQGEGGQGLELLERGLANLRTVGIRYHLAHRLGLRVEVLMTEGAIEEGISAAEECLAVVEDTGERWFEPEALRLLAVAKARRAAVDPSVVRSLLWRSLKAAEELEARYWKLRTARSLARLLREAGEIDDARNLLAPVYGWFTEGFDTADLKDAKALLDELG